MGLLANIYKYLFRAYLRQLRVEIKNKFKLHSTVRLNYPDKIFLSGNIHIGKHTYINGARIVSGPNTRIEIGEWCAIGHNVNIIGWTHDPCLATGDINSRPTIEKDIVIGDNVWIGSNVFSERE